MDDVKEIFSKLIKIINANHPPLPATDIIEARNIGASYGEGTLYVTPYSSEINIVEALGRYLYDTGYLPNRIYKVARAAARVVIDIDSGEAIMLDSQPSPDIIQAMREEGFTPLLLEEWEEYIPEELLVARTVALYWVEYHGGVAEGLKRARKEVGNE